MPTRSPLSSPATRRLAEQALSRSAGAPLLGGHAVELLIDAEAHYRAWLEAIGNARRSVLLENYIIRNDEVGRTFRAALIERARAGVVVAVLVDWLGCLGESGRKFWQPLRAAGGQVAIFNPPRLGQTFGWLSRDHRKLLVVDGAVGFLSGVCISAQWLGKPERKIPPWRDTGVALRGPAVADMQAAFVQTWAETRMPVPVLDTVPETTAGNMALRLIATQPASAGIYRLDQMIAALARKTLWLTDAYFVGTAPYVQALIAAVRDGVDVRLLVPSTSDLPLVANLSRSGYRPLLEAGVRVFEWNGSMLHAKTAVADQQWARVGSSNLNLASWLNNREIDVAIEDAGFAAQLAAQYQADLERSTEIVLSPRKHRRAKVGGRQARAHHPHLDGGSSGRAATGALRLANRMGAVLIDQRVLGPADAALLGRGALVLFVVAVLAWV